MFGRGGHGSWPDRLNIRTFDEQARERVLSSVRRIIAKQAELSRSPKPPEFKTLNAFPLTINDEDATRKVADALEGRMGDDRVQRAGLATASEDFTVLARAWDAPSVYWLVGGIDPQRYAEAQRVPIVLAATAQGTSMVVSALGCTPSFRPWRATCRCPRSSGAPSPCLRC